MPVHDAQKNARMLDCGAGLMAKMPFTTDLKKKN